MPLLERHELTSVHRTPHDRRGDRGSQRKRHLSDTGGDCCISNIAERRTMQRLNTPLADVSHTHRSSSSLNPKLQTPNPKPHRSSSLRSGCCCSSSLAPASPRVLFAQPTRRSEAAGGAKGRTARGQACSPAPYTHSSWPCPLQGSFTSSRGKAMSHKQPHLIFVLAGQSNMAGRGALEQALSASPQVLMLSGEDGQVPTKLRY